MRVIPRKTDPVSLEDSHFKAMGDNYERFIGNNLEEKGEVVIYNGFIMGLLDNGVDLISISTLNKRISLIQCKNWKNTQIIQSDLIDIHSKLSTFYKGDITTFYSFQYKNINSYATKPYDENMLKELMSNIKNSSIPYEIIKTLYLSSVNSIDSGLYNLLELVKPNIYKYKDMKIVIKTGDAF